MNSNIDEKKDWTYWDEWLLEPEYKNGRCLRLCSSYEIMNEPPVVPMRNRGMNNNAFCIIFVKWIKKCIYSFGLA